MTLYFNNSENGIEITQYNQSYNYVNPPREQYSITLADSEDIDTLDAVYGDATITDIKIVKDGQILKNSSNLNLSLEFISYFVDETHESRSMSLRSLSNT
jgi:hypothetical protein